MKRLLMMVAVLALTGLGGLNAQEKKSEKPAEPTAKPVKKANDVGLGQVHIPKPFIHGGQEYPAGNYRIVLTQKEAEPFFQVMNGKKEVLFEEMAAVKPFPPTSGKKFSQRVKKGMLKENEYFRIRVERPGQVISAYFLIK
jgi:hypothetical protein